MHDLRARAQFARALKVTARSKNLTQLAGPPQPSRRRQGEAKAKAYHKYSRQLAPGGALHSFANRVLGELKVTRNFHFSRSFVADALDVLTAQGTVKPVRRSRATDVVSITPARDLVRIKVFQSAGL